MVAVLAAGVLGGYLRYRAVWDSISRVAVTGLGKRPPKYTSALNLLVFGSGSTAGLSRRQQVAWQVGRDSGDAVSETLMIRRLRPVARRLAILAPGAL
jgi:hypothetical protein